MVEVVVGKQHGWNVVRTCPIRLRQQLVHFVVADGSVRGECHVRAGAKGCGGMEVGVEVEGREGKGVILPDLALALLTKSGLGLIGTSDRYHTRYGAVSYLQSESMSAGLFSLRRGVGVINDQMIKVSVRSDMKANREEKDIAQALARREKRKANNDQESKVNYDRVVVMFEDVTSLSLSYHNIDEIKNLVGLSRLTTLKLDNNTITRIENLDHLVHLTWLDLSFNNIEQITGLTALTKLTDLSLFNNSIETIEGLDTLKNLEVLSLGNNKMNDLDNLKDLRTFTKLRMLCLDDNPIVSLCCPWWWCPWCPRCPLFSCCFCSCVVVSDAPQSLFVWLPTRTTTTATPKTGS